MKCAGMSFRLGTLSAGIFSKMSWPSAARYGASSRRMASNGGLFLAAVIFAIVSKGSAATRFTFALLVALRNAGTRMERCASSHAPG
jgi:hypothetical protein